MLSGTTRGAATESILRLAAMIVLAGMVVLISACATTGDEADLPWNTQEPWEAHPGIPGLSDY